MITLYLNDKKIETSAHPGTTVLDFIRKHQQLTGTKIGCREGDCGACTVLVGALKKSELLYQSMTSCLMPLANAHGKHIVTVEGVNGKHLTPVQEALVSHGGTQCGFCTIGFVMSLTGFALTGKGREKAIASIDGNICRCTGYKSIERAAMEIADKIAQKPSAGSLEWLVENEFIPKYFLDIKSKLTQLEKAHKSEQETASFVGGGTDLYVQRQEEMTHEAFVPVFDDPALKGIEEKEGKCFLGASVTVSEIAESDVMQSIFPDLKVHLKLVSSTPIRNMATLAGNFVNASPIGDMTVFFLALDSSIILNDSGLRRTIKLKDFYQGYKQLDKKEGEFVERVFFDIPKGWYRFNFEKVCKRTHLDIASVNTACLLEFDDQNTITSAHLSAGGIAPVPKCLERTAAYFKGKKVAELAIGKVDELLQSEVSPISDVRGSKEYKRLLLRQLVFAHLLKLEPDLDTMQ
ncbi:MAG: FAD binding domain-containing protein [Saprospiraceae bacterium]|nr:FAD binding domain-containing protein [Saprospiraceae bacterium]MCB9324810.1 FAD binding domain-containing protein [Lewinellaceae bacterium]